MRADPEVKADILRALQWDPRVPRPNAIGVAVRAGTVTLTGYTSTFGEKLAAVRIASRVDGVEAVADELKVRFAGEPRDDSDIARAIAYALEGNTLVEAGQVHATVERGWVTLDGQAERDYQRYEVERMVRHARGITGITNNIAVSRPLSEAPRPT